MNTSEFYMTAINMINNETLRLDNFCDALDKDADEKKKQIVEYKRAKYRYAGITNVWCVLRLNYRNRATNARTNYLAPKINEIFTSNERYLSAGKYTNIPGSVHFIKVSAKKKKCALFLHCKPKFLFAISGLVRSMSSYQKPRHRAILKRLLS